jgi:hypothetical protein
MRSMIVAAGLVLMPALAVGQVPHKLGYQARLLKSDGTPASGIVEIAFSIFDAETAGKQLFTEKQMVGLTDGYYSTFLGSATATGFPAGTFDGSERFLELTVAGETLKPRQRIASVAYALVATDARNVVGGKVDATSVTVGGKTVISPTGAIVFPDGSAQTTAAAGTKWTPLPKTRLVSTAPGTPDEYLLPATIPASATEAFFYVRTLGPPSLPGEGRVFSTVSGIEYSFFLTAGGHPNVNISASQLSWLPVGSDRKVHRSGCCVDEIYVIGYR